MRVGSAEIGGLVEVVEWTPERDMAWTSVTGIDQRGRWRLRATGAPNRTRVELRLRLRRRGLRAHRAGSAERVAAPTVGRHLRRSLQQLKRQVEHEQLRRQAAERRSARGGATRARAS